MEVVLKDYVPIQPKPIVRLKVTPGVVRSHARAWERVQKQSCPIDYCARKEMKFGSEFVPLEALKGRQSVPAVRSLTRILGPLNPYHFHRLFWRYRQRL